MYKRLAGSLLVGFLLTVLPVSFEYYRLAWFRPEWVALIVIYWVISQPADFGVLFAWLVGLLLDVFEGSLLGQHALALSIVAYLGLIVQRRVNLLGLWQQCAVMFVMIGVFQLLCHWVQNLTGATRPNLLFLWACLTSACCWPLVRLCLDRLRRGAM